MHAKLVEIKIFVIQKQKKKLTEQNRLLTNYVPYSGLSLTIYADLW